MLQPNFTRSIRSHSSQSSWEPSELDIEVCDRIPWNVLKKLPPYMEHEAVFARISPQLLPLKLSGAAKFQRYLERQCRSPLYMCAPFNPKTPFQPWEERDGEKFFIDWKAWEIYTERGPLGRYFAGSIEPNSGKIPNYKRRFEGRIPGRINEGIVELNKEREYTDTLGERQSRRFIPEDFVVLQYGYQNMPDARMQRTETIWRRFDGHKDIPFP